MRRLLPLAALATLLLTAACANNEDITSAEIVSEIPWNGPETAEYRVLDSDDRPTTGSFLIRDQRQRVFPSQTKRLAPDFFFHPQVYRADGEGVHLPPGEYTIEYSRGPEYR